MKDHNPQLLKKSLELKKSYRDISMEHWWAAEFNHWQWWLSLVLSIIPLFIWWKLLDKKRIFEICVYGLMIYVFASYMDLVGSEFVWWNYPIRVIPTLPRIFPIDFSVIPTVYMLVYQYFPKWKEFIVANTIVAGIFAFAMEPLMIWMNLYTLETWKLIYSFPIYILMAVICKVFVNGIYKVSVKEKSDQNEK
jgi:hypothetical protein